MGEKCATALLTETEVGNAIPVDDASLLLSSIPEGIGQ